ncbi:hypothetical protein [Azospirillum humicireducens]|uniref:hypothetical protein n=1 Tax=Azospirillum humicireducens TaxID=1226968 RepID=UPI0011B276AA|nr:hypothetical protein [Azospirillum humicireducens]
MDAIVKIVFSNLMLAAAVMLPSTVMAQGMPSGMVFFFTSGAICPSGSSRVDDASGRLILGTLQPANVGIANSAETMKDQTPPSHTHAATFTFNVGSNSIKSAGGSRDTGTSGQKSSTIGFDVSSGDLPYTQILVCKAN